MGVLIQAVVFLGAGFYGFLDRRETVIQNTPYSAENERPLDRSLLLSQQTELVTGAVVRTGPRNSVGGDFQCVPELHM
jgi:hypothetical protein